MSILTGRSVVLVALLATLGGAFRHNLADVSKHMKHMKHSGEPPDVEALSAEAQNVIQAKIAAATAAQQHAMEMMMNLGSAQVGVASGVDGKDNNTHKRNLTMEATQAVYTANIVKKQAEDVKAAVESMIEACLDIFRFADKHQGARERTLVQKTEAAAQQEAGWSELLEEVIEAEMGDLDLLIGKVDAIKEAVEKVDSADAEIGSGAAEGITAAAELIYSFAVQLQDRQRELIKSQSFEDWPELVSGEIKTEIDAHAAAGLKTALAHLEAKINEHRTTFEAAMAQMTVLGSSTNMTNKTAMDELVQQQFQANIAKAKAEALQRLVEHCIELINAFFAMFAGYKQELPIKMAAATQNADAIKAQHDELHAAADLAELLAASGIYQLYQTMWTRYSEAKKPMPRDDGDYMTLKANLKSTAEAVHQWVNEEFFYLCEYYGSCRDARAQLMKLLEKDNSWCDERFDGVTCTGMKNGRQPNGKMCKWVKMTDEEAQAGGKDYCKSNSPPTNNLIYGKDHPDGPGLFY